MASAGSAPAASLKRDVIEDGWRVKGYASAGSAPAASLKPTRREVNPRIAVRIRGVCPRGLIEARRLLRIVACLILVHPRGLPPRPH